MLFRNSALNIKSLRSSAWRSFTSTRLCRFSSFIQHKCPLLILTLIINHPYISDVENFSMDKEGCPVTFEDISRALYRIRSGVRRTNCVYSDFLSELTECKVYIKKDFCQFTGSFKERGGRNSLMLLPDEMKKRGVITASAGNHALALAYHGRDLGIPVTCVMPSIAPLTKVNNCRKFGANVILHGSHIGEARYSIIHLNCCQSL